jgi:hypothetical protein
MASRVARDRRMAARVPGWPDSQEPSIVRQEGSSLNVFPFLLGKESACGRLFVLQSELGGAAAAHVAGPRRPRGECAIVRMPA